jgi:hypothetical protein
MRRNLPLRSPTPLPFRSHSRSRNDAPTSRRLPEGRTSTRGESRTVWRHSLACRSRRVSRFRARFRRAACPLNYRSALRGSSRSGMNGQFLLPRSDRKPWISMATSLLTPPTKSSFGPSSVPNLPFRSLATIQTLISLRQPAVHDGVPSGCNVRPAGWDRPHRRRAVRPSARMRTSGATAEL